MIIPPNYQRDKTILEEALKASGITGVDITSCIIDRRTKEGQTLFVSTSRDKAEKVKVLIELYGGTVHRSINFETSFWCSF